MLRSVRLAQVAARRYNSSSSKENIDKMVNSLKQAVEEQNQDGQQDIDNSKLSGIMKNLKKFSPSSEAGSQQEGSSPAQRDPRKQERSRDQRDRRSQRSADSQRNTNRRQARSVEGRNTRGDGRRDNRQRSGKVQNRSQESGDRRRANEAEDELEIEAGEFDADEATTLAPYRFESEVYLANKEIEAMDELERISSGAETLETRMIIDENVSLRNMYSQDQYKEAVAKYDEELGGTGKFLDSIPEVRGVVDEGESGSQVNSSSADAAEFEDNVMTDLERLELAIIQKNRKKMSINEMVKLYEKIHQETQLSTEEEYHAKQILNSPSIKNQSKSNLLFEISKMPHIETTMLRNFAVREELNDFKKTKMLESLGKSYKPSQHGESSKLPFDLNKSDIEEALIEGKESNLNKIDAIVKLMNKDHIASDITSYKLNKDKVPTKELLDLNSPRTGHTQKSRVLRAVDQYLHKKSGGRLSDLGKEFKNMKFSKYVVVDSEGNSVPEHQNVTISNASYPYTSRNVSPGSAYVSKQYIDLAKVETAEDFKDAIRSTVYGIRKEVPVPKRQADNSNISEIAMANALNSNTQLHVDDLHLKMAKSNFTDVPKSITGTSN